MHRKRVATSIAIVAALFASTVMANPASAQAAATISFSFKTYAKNVRVGEGLVGDFQLGTATLTGSGVLAADGKLLSGGTIYDVDVPLPGTRFTTRTMTLKTISGTFAETATAKTLALRVEIVSTNDTRDCPVGAQATVTLTDSAVALSNGQNSDSVLENGYSSFCGHDHGWTNQDRTISDPLQGGPGGGNWADVQIQGGGRCQPGTTLPRPQFGSPEPAPVNCMTLQAGQRNVVAGQEVWVPIWMINGANVANINYEIAYNTNVVSVAQSGVTKGSFLAAGLMQANAQQAGVIRVGNAQTTGESGTGSISWVKFRAVGRPGDQTNLTVTVTTINEPGGAVLPIARIDGLIKILDSSGLLPGDCTGKGYLDSSDAICALQMSVGLRPVNLVMDMDKSGDVTSRDATLIQQKVLAAPGL